MKYLVTINERALPDTTDPGFEFRYLDIGSVGRGTIASEPAVMRFEQAPSRARRVLRSGDTVVSTVRTYLRAVMPISATLANCIASTGFAVLTPSDELDPRFLGWWCQSDPFVEEIVARSVGVSYPAVNATEIGDVRMPIPSLDEQRAIAEFLDTETARIDALITTKRRLIELLDEWFRSYRVEQMLGRFNPMTGSGDLSNGWRNVSLGVCIQLQRGHDLPDQDRVQGEVPIISSGGVTGWHNRAAAQGPGVVTGRYGSIGEAFFVEGPYWPLNTTLYVKDFRGNCPRWVLHLLAVLPLDSESAKSAVTGINRNVIGMLRVPLPPLRDQQRVADEIGLASTRVEAAKAPLARQIDLLVEHRQALIAAAVTGELAVPRVAA